MGTGEQVNRPGKDRAPAGTTMVDAGILFPSPNQASASHGLIGLSPPPPIAKISLSQTLSTLNPTPNWDLNPN